MGRKTIPTARTKDTRKQIMDQSKDPDLAVICKAIIDVQERDGLISLAVIKTSDVTRLELHITELEIILGTTVVVERLPLLEIVCQMGVDFLCRSKSDQR